jgi:ParB/RepB/Spo0J family partition protein
MATAVKETSAPAGEYQPVPIGIIEVDKGFNNRRSLGDISELAESIKSVGLLQPLLVWKREVNGATTEPKGYLHVIAGHRRLAACKLAGLTHVDVKIVTLDEKGRMEALLVENLHREGIDPLEEAEGYKRLLAFGLKQQDIAAKVGRSPAHVSKRLSILELSPEVHQLITSGKLHLADALELIPYVKEPEVIAETLKHVRESIKNGWGFRVDDHARGAKRRIEQERKRQIVLGALKAEKVSLVTQRNTWDLTQLGQGANRLPMTPAAHSKFPCHAAFVEDHDLSVHYVCTKPANHKTSDVAVVAKAAKALTSGRSYGGEKASKDQAKKAAASRERNKVLKVREPLRTAELKRLLTARQKREDVLDFTLRNLLQLLVNSDYEVAERAAAFLEIPMGKKSHTYDRANPEFAAFLSGGNGRLFKLAYAFALASGEEPFAKLMKQGYFDQEYSTNATRYLDHLQANGYKPDKVELAQLPKQENGYRWKDAFDKVKPKGKEKS